MTKNELRMVKMADENMASTSHRLKPYGYDGFGTCNFIQMLTRPDTKLLRKNQNYALLKKKIKYKMYTLASQKL